MPLLQFRVYPNSVTTFVWRTEEVIDTVSTKCICNASTPVQSLSKFRDYFYMKDGGSDRHGKHRKYSLNCSTEKSQKETWL
jgi:hypothetical protein